MTDQANVLRDRVRARAITTEPNIYEPQAETNLARVITITSGKGGVGKTNIAVNLAINFIKKGKKVIILDADFGLANIEVLFGVVPEYSLAHVIFGNKKIEDVISDGYRGVKFISAGSGFKELANITESQMQFIINSFIYLDSNFDIVIIDTGAGISESVLNFIKVSTETIIVTSPEPTSLTDCYTIIKTITESENKIPVLKLLINKVENEDEGIEVFKKLNNVCKKFLNTNMISLGSIPDDKYLVKAVKRQIPITICYPYSEFAKAMEKISRNLMEVNQQNFDKSEGIMSYMKKLVNIFKH